ncbi:D-alanine--D-alanine ligase [Reinekea thalattae]|uniref:D-alanine--D-alanine ligase n=1 Tax=Reinekea thalattae TaxID=2593301 RepID=A0A5C8Z782_9GAMM|nr:D-alanine--D-alanine ligase [Reinekea thalattae]TXR53011.1 D-alanine--D-alanine ligase [Reinekea thalattae]
MSKKIKVGLVFGGRSAEHQVSLQSAQSILSAIDSDKFEVVKIGISAEGTWLLNDSADVFLNGDDPENIALAETAKPVALVAGESNGALKPLTETTVNNSTSLDVLFPILHGPYGEDGSIQGLAKLANIACVGSGILSSSVGMDKDFTKRILIQAGIAVADFMTLKSAYFTEDDVQRIEATFNYPVFIKPANMGSSIGVSCAHNREQLLDAIQSAFKYDKKLLVEQAIKGRELECAVLGNDHPRASVVGEIIASDGFYDYESKYIDANAAKLSLPADISEQLSERIQQTSLAVFKALECRGMARVDMFVTDDEQIIINEVNTLPGFTKISMYPNLWAASGLSYTDLISELIELAIEDYRP